MALFGISDGTGWGRRRESSSKVVTKPVCIVQNEEIADVSVTGYVEGYLPAGTLLVPDTDVSGEACYVVMDTARLVTGGTGEQNEAHALVLFEEIYGLDTENKLGTALLKGVWSSGRLRHKGTALTAAQRSEIQRLVEWWISE